jgi:hypothetical protein
MILLYDTFHYDQHKHLIFPNGVNGKNIVHMHGCGFRTIHLKESGMEQATRATITCYMLWLKYLTEVSLPFGELVSHLFLRPV